MVQLAGCLDVSQFQKAWDIIVRCFPILRSRICRIGTGKVAQVVVKGIIWKLLGLLDVYLIAATRHLLHRVIVLLAGRYFRVMSN